MKKPQIGNLVNVKYGWRGVITDINKNGKILHLKKLTAVVEGLDGLRVAWTDVSNLIELDGEWYEQSKPISWSITFTLEDLLKIAVLIIFLYSLFFLLWFLFGYCTHLCSLLSF